MNVIADHPTPEMYATGQEIGCQCARCGGSCDWKDCYECEDGYIDRHAEDPLWYGHELYDCQCCLGRGGYVCGNSPEWCEANPLPGRESINRGKLEWFTFPLAPQPPIG